MGEPSVCRHYRSMVPMQALILRGHEITICDSAGPGCPRSADNPAQLLGADVVLGYRMMFNNEASVRRAVASGAAFIWDTDDDMANLPHEGPLFKGMGARGVADVVQRLARIARFADIVTTTSPQLAAKYRGLGAKHVVVVPNFLASGSVHQVIRRFGTESVTIGWLAAHEHKADVKRVPIVRALRRLLTVHPHVRVESAGVPLALPADRYRFRRWVDIKQLPNLLATWDIGIAPLADIPFNRARSDVKLKEYGTVALPWLASPVGPYRDKGEEHGGRLVRDYEWFEALDRLVTDVDARQQLSANAHAWAVTQTIDHQAQIWEDVCLEAVRRRTSRSAA
ncbi:hypothetical protein Q5424_00245 [Conexibacter sp. JD483]|uniref:hypothetical protein n=1 Tax=unclassified Conexibacter TaxID=2627773 RepID=UPI002717036C|nr:MULTISPECIES: hypothetical protein [unclassified Conexibacter]MDO8184206.1 hypothetical protein [Conexibacter sp. CPCC 205706]MDO8197198.1 hypothetical protein [Conexibacter sp. CPCC 205762]MDR9367487.1 hypothetical protein [Conexibacter sp. JD483]